jgi:hypothetical protein
MSSSETKDLMALTDEGIHEMDAHAFGSEAAETQGIDYNCPRVS